MKKIYLWSIIFLAYMEIIFHIFAFNDFNIITPILSIIFIALLLSILTLIFKPKINKIISIVSVSLITILYIAQFISIKVIGSVFSLKSITMAGNVVDAYDNVISSILKNWYVIILFLLPLIISCIFIRKHEEIFSSKKVFIGIISSYIIFIFALLINKNDIFSNYNLYFSLNQPILTARRLGLMTEFRLDVQRLIFPVKENLEIVKNSSDGNKIIYDFEKLKNNEKNKEIKQLHNYFLNQKATNDNEYTGKFKGKNLIYILAESLDSIAIDENLTPTLYKLTNEGFVFENYYSPLFPKSTSDAEYMLDWGILPRTNNESNIIDSTGNYNPLTLVHNFNELGYSTFAYHNYYGYFYNRKDYFKELGYQNYKFCDDGIVKSCEMGDFYKASDKEMFENTINDFINEDNFYVHYVTLSGHGTYKYSKNDVAKKYWDYVKDFDYPDELKVYLGANMDLDQGIKVLIDALEEKNKLKDTVFVIVPDHYPYYLNNNGLEVLNKRSDIDRTDKFNLYKTSLIIWNSEMEKQNISNYTSIVDVLPTVLNLFGIEYDSRLLIGKDVLNNHDGLIILSDYSWINKYGRFNAATNKFTCNKPCEVDEKYVENTNKYVKNAFTASSLVQRYDYYKYLKK